MVTRADLGPGAAVGWFAVSGKPEELAGAGFLIGRRLVLTCAHVVRDHLRLPEPLAAAAPTAPVRICFAASGTTIEGHVLAGGWFPNTGNPADGLCDIALIRLADPVEDIPAPASRGGCRRNGPRCWCAGPSPATKATARTWTQRCVATTTTAACANWSNRAVRSSSSSRAFRARPPSTVPAATCSA